MFYQCCDNVFSLYMVQSVQSGGGQTYGQDNDPNISYCVLSTSTKCSYQQGSGAILFVYIMWPHWKENLPLLWYLGKLKFLEEIKCFVKIFVPGRNQRNQSVQWNYCTHTHTLRLVSPWGCPGTYPVAQYIAQYTADCHTAQRGYPMAQRLPLQSPQHTQHTLASGRAYPAYPSFRNRHTHGTQLTQHSRRPQGPDYKTALPANREHNAQRRQNTEKAWQRQIQRNSPEEANIEKKPSRGKSGKTTRYEYRGLV